MPGATPMSLPDPWIPWEETQLAGKSTAVAVATGTIVGTNNDAHLVPVVFPCDATLYAIRVGGMNATGNYDIGFYNASFARLASKGSTAMASAMLELTLPNLRVFGGEQYYAAFSCSNTGGQIVRAAWTIAAMQVPYLFGLQASAHPLPDPFVPASAAIYTVAPVFAFGIR